MEEARAADQELLATQRSALQVELGLATLRQLGAQNVPEVEAPQAPHFVADLHRHHRRGPTLPPSGAERPAAPRSGPRRAPRPTRGSHEAPGSAWDDASRLSIEAAGFEVEQADPDTAERLADGPEETNITELAAWVAYANRTVT